MAESDVWNEQPVCYCVITYKDKMIDQQALCRVMYSLLSLSSSTDSTEDKTITTDGAMYVIWARGNINADGRVAYHNQQRSPSKNEIL